MASVCGTAFGSLASAADDDAPLWEVLAAWTDVVPRGPQPATVHATAPSMTENRPTAMYRNTMLLYRIGGVLDGQTRNGEPI
jgi:hypothetical protein